jgi:hypothetical protein
MTSPAAAAPAPPAAIRVEGLVHVYAGETRALAARRIDVTVVAAALAGAAR